MALIAKVFIEEGVVSLRFFNFMGSHKILADKVARHAGRLVNQKVQAKIFGY
jgi:hypothetical protein